MPLHANRWTDDPFLRYEDPDADQQRETEDKQEEEEDNEKQDEDEEEEQAEGTASRHTCCDDVFSICNDVFSVWLPDTWKTVTTCFGTAFTLFVVFLVEDLSAVNTYVVLGVIGLLVIGACAAGCVAINRHRAVHQTRVDEVVHMA